MNFQKKFGKRFNNISNRGIVSKEEINNSSFDTGWRNSMLGITNKLESEENILVGDSLINISKILAGEAELSMNVLTQFRGDMKKVEDGSASLVKSVDANTLRELETILPLQAMSEMQSSIKRTGVDRQIIDALIASKVLYKVVSELEELKKVIIQGYEEGHMSEELAKEMGVFGFGKVEEDKPKTTLVSKRNGGFGKTEEDKPKFQRKGFGKGVEESSPFGGFGGKKSFGGGSKFGSTGGGTFGKSSGGFGKPSPSSIFGKQSNTTGFGGGSKFSTGSTFGKNKSGFGR